MRAKKPLLICESDDDEAFIPGNDVKPESLYITIH